jgi:eukaryotic-like serine/threonine-protein kinase
MSSPTQGRGAEGELGSIGPYTLVSEIARGELAIIYLATRSLPGGGQRRAVFKMLRPEFAGDATQRELLDHEARVMAALHHPNIAAVLPDAADTPDAVPYEYVDGETLGALLARADVALKPKLLLPIFSDVLRGLASVHGALSAEGEPLYLVHQAPCARHIIVGTDGGSRIVDFSQSLSLDATASRARADRLRVAYMAPEQALDPDNVDARADLFVLGITLWEALTGEPLFAGADAAETFQNMLHREVQKPSTVGRKPPPAFDALCMRALERPRERRFSTAGEMLAALSDVGRSMGGAATAFEVGQWVMALAGATLRARHGKLRTPSTAPRGSSIPAPSGRPIVVARPPKAAAPSTPAREGPTLPPEAEPPSARPPESAPAAERSAAPAPVPDPVAAPPPVERLNTPLPPTPGAYGAASKLSASAPPKRDIRTNLPPPAESQRPSAPSLAALADVPEPAPVAEPASAVTPADAHAPGASPASSRPPGARPARPSEGGVGFSTLPGGFVGGVPVVSAGTPPPAAPAGRQRVRTLQSLAAVSVVPPATLVGDRSDSPTSPPAGHSSTPRGGSPSDSPTEILSTEQAQQLSALTAAATAAQPEPRRGAGADGARPRFGRATEELYSMPPRSTSSAPDETVVGDRAQLELDTRASARGATSRPLSSTLIGAVAPASIRPHRASIEGSEAPSTPPTPGTELAVSATAARSDGALAPRPRRAPSEASSLASYSPSRGFSHDLASLFFVPLIDDESPFPGDSSRPTAAGAAPTAAELAPPSQVRRRWGWLAVLAAFVVAGAVLYLNAQNHGAPSAPEDTRAELAPPPPATLPPPSSPPAVPSSGSIGGATRTLPPPPSPGPESSSAPAAPPAPGSPPAAKPAGAPASSAGGGEPKPAARSSARPRSDTSKPSDASKATAGARPSRASEPSTPTSTAPADKPVAGDKPSAGDSDVEVPSNPY